MIAALRKRKSCSVDGNDAKFQRLQNNPIEVLRELQTDMKRDFNDNLEEQIKVEVVEMTEIAEMNGEKPTIKELIYGKWMSTGISGELYISMMFDYNDKLILNWDSMKSVVYTLGVRHPDGCTFYIEDEKIVQIWLSWRREYYLENGKLVLLDQIPGNDEKKFIFTRVGDPDVYYY